MKRKQISALAAAMFTGAGVLIAGTAQADNFVDRGNPDNALSGQCIDGTNPQCLATKSGTYVAVSTNNVTMGTNAKASASGIAIGDQSNAASKGGTSNGGAIAIGVGSQALANSATAIGTVAVAQGNTALAIGRQSAAVGDFSMALGNVADAHGTSSIALGHSALASGDRSVAIGGANPTTSDGVSAGASYDAATQTRAGGTQSVAIGAGAQTNDNNQVAIGSGSTGANNGGTTVFGGTAAPVGGAVSFGAIGKERQLKNVAAGAADTDAVNVQQLKNVNGTLSTSIATVDARVTSVGNSLSTTISNVDQRVTNVGNSLSTSIVTATKNVVKYTDDSHAAIALDGSNGTKIGGVATGVADTDAVNVGQLKGTVAPLQTSISTAASNITNLQTSVTGINTSLSTATTNITNLQAADARNVKYDGQSGFDSVTFAGTDGTTLHNVAAGVANTDAVNVGQLNGGLSSLSTSVTNNLSTTLGNLSTSVTNQIGNATKNAVQYDDDAHSGVTLGGKGAQSPVGMHNVADGVVASDAVNVGQLGKATDTLNQSITTVSNNVTTLGNQVTTNTGNIAALQQDALQWNANLGTYDASHGGNGPQRIGNVAAGVANTDAVNVGQLTGTVAPLQTSISTAASNITNLQTSVTGINTSLSTATTNISDLQAADARNVKYDGKSGFDSVTFAGTNGTTLHNVAAGVANTDAVNVGQLNGGLSSLSTSVTNNLSTTLGNLSTSVTNQIGNATKNAVQYDDDAHSGVTLGGKGAQSPVGMHNVADGVAASDAVNVGQLGKATDTLNQSITNVGNQVTTNTGNIAALQQDALQWNANLGTYDASHGGNGPQRIGNVAAGVANTDAVNVGQLTGTVAPLQSSISTAASNITNLQTSVTGINTSLSTATTNISNLQAADARNVKYDGQSGFDSVTFAGTNGTTLHNVAAGVANTDAVNVGQLNGGLSSLSTSVTNNISTTLGNLSTSVNNQIGNATKNAVQYDDDAHSGVTLGGKGAQSPVGVHNVADGLVASDAVNVGQLGKATDTLNQSITTVSNNVTTLGNQVTTNTGNIAALQQDALQWNANLGTYDASHGGNGPQRIGNVAAGVANTDAVNVGQLTGSIAPLQSSISTAASNITNLQSNVTGINASLSTATTNITNLQAADTRNVKYDGKSGFDSVTFAGTNGTTLHNVAAGVANTDAVNVGQLNGGLSSLSTSVTNNISTTLGNLSTSINNQIGNATKNAVQYDDDAHSGVTLGGKGAQSPVGVHNVADGLVASDAVNVGQLGKATDTLNQSITTVSNNVTTLGNQVTTNTGNIAALQQDALQWNANLGTYDASHGGNGPQRIGNVAAGKNGTDAVNVDQLNAAIQDGTSQLDALAVKYDDASKKQVSLGAGNGGSPVRLTNVAEGNVAAGSTDAVNGAQLRRATDGTAAALGGGAKANPDGTISAPTYKVGDGSFNNVGDALTNLDTRVGSNTTTLENHETRIGNAETNIAGNTAAIAGLQQDALQFDPKAGAYNAARGGAPTKLTNVADGNIAAGSTDAVNGGQLSGVKSSLEQQITQVSNQAGEAVKNVVKYDVDANGNRMNSVSLIGGDTKAAVVLKNVAAGTDDTDAVNVKQLKSVQSNLNQLGALAVQYDDSSKSSITLGGAGGTRITNVQAGTLSSTSTDAVNGSQLYATNQQVAKNTTDITNLQGNVTNIANGKAGLVQQQDPNGAITVGKDSGGTSVNFSGTAGDRVLTGVAAGVKDNDAVNMGQFNNALKNAAANDQIRAAATDANTTWIARADAGSIGSTATATGKNAVAVGQGSVADRDNSFSVGAKGSERQVTNVAAGTAPTDAVNVQQLNDNLSTATTQAKGYTDQRIGQVYNSFNDLKKDMYGGVASAMAVAGLPQPTGAGRSMVSAATSNYHGQQGFAAGYSYVTESNRWVVKASVTGNARSDFGAVVGAGYQF
ncbi:hemagglutinin [Burkholderia aenigmatica]|uniref:Hemagglutinin n=2 Tax=Burkholderia aenigmatica TaxID=2015348 RepID=A0ABY6Y399_9BURK|nr:MULTISPECIES: YadA-like family protein [Burkholderia]VWD28754.1 hemagglutinin [Burkholderia aenigmatica]VWD52954.1 hemagglutinin [Burkholderia aenigmatica]